MANGQTTVRLADEDLRLGKRAGGAVVIGGKYSALGVVRSLGRRGIPVWVLTDDHFIAAVSRYARGHLPWPTEGDSRRLEFLLELGRRRGLAGWAIFATDDEPAAFLARHHVVLSEHFRVTTPPWEVLRWGYDKRLTYRLGQELSVYQPRTFFPAGRDEVARLECDFPVILKPAFKPELNRFTHAKAWYVDSRERLLSGYDEAAQLVPRDIIMIQELIPGNGEQQFSFAALCLEGRPLGWMTARRTRQYPIDFGLASSCVESIDVPEIEGPARRLLEAIRLTGLVELEFKRDPRDDRYKLLDINLRVWGWHTLGQRAGVDFSYLLWRLIHGETVQEVRARHGVRWLRMSTDLPAVIGEWLRRRLSVRDYLRSLRGPVEFAVFAMDDPLPALFDAPWLAWMAWKRRTNPRAKAADESTGDFGDSLHDC